MQEEDGAVLTELQALRSTNPLLQDFDHYWVIDTYAPEDRNKVEVHALSGNDLVEIYLKEYEFLTGSILWVNVFKDDPTFPTADELRKQLETSDFNDDPDTKALVLAQILVGHAGLQERYSEYKDLRKRFMAVGHRYKDRIKVYVDSLPKDKRMGFKKFMEELKRIGKEEINAAFDKTSDTGMLVNLPYEQHLHQDEMIPHYYLREELTEDITDTLLKSIDNLATSLKENSGSSSYKRYTLPELQAMARTEKSNFQNDDVTFNTRFRSCPAQAPVTGFFRIMASTFEFSKYGIRKARQETLRDFAT